jgi:hypothetical protein
MKSTATNLQSQIDRLRNRVYPLEEEMKLVWKRLQDVEGNCDE